MIRNLDKKIADSKYHGSLIIGAGRLKGTQRTNFVDTIAAHNILLAVQCIVECEQDETYERTLLKKAKKAARNFRNLLEAERGILALAKMQANQEIVMVFEEIKKTPNKTHKIVIENLINNAEPNQALDFILLLLDLPKNKNCIIQWSINIVNIGELPSNYGNAKKLILKLIDFPTFFQLPFAAALVKKYKLDYKFIEIVIQKLLHRKNKFVIVSVKNLIFASELILKFSSEKQWGEKIMQLLIDSKNFESLKLAPELVQKFNLEKQWGEKIMRLLIDSKNFESLKLASELIQKFNLEKHWGEKIIQKLIEFGNFLLLELAIGLIQKYNLETLFPIKDITKEHIKGCIDGSKTSLKNAYLLSLANDLNYSKDKFIEILADKYAEKYLSLYKVWIHEIFSQRFKKEELLKYKLSYSHTYIPLINTKPNTPSGEINVNINESAEITESIDYLLNEKYAQAIISFFKKQFDLNNKYETSLVNASAGTATCKKLKKLFPHPDWWLYTLQQKKIIQVIDSKNCIILKHPNLDIFQKLIY